MLDDVAVVVNLINVAVDVIKYDGDADDDGFTVEFMDELLVGNDDNEDDVDGVDDVVCEVIPVDVVVDDVRVVASKLLMMTMMIIMLKKCFDAC